MAQPFSIDTLRDHVARDMETAKLQKARFLRLQGTAPEEITESDRNSIINWSRSSITDYNAQLDRMEQIDQPSKEEKEVMQQLIQLIVLGDQIHDYTRSFLEKYEAKFGTIENKSESLPEGAFVRPDGKIVIRKKKQKAVPGNEVPLTAGETTPVLEPASTPTPATQDIGKSPPHVEPAAPRPAPLSPSAQFDSFPLSQAEASSKPASSAPPAASAEETTGTENCDGGGEEDLVDDPDPKGIYAELGVQPDASMSVIKRYPPVCLFFLGISLMVCSAYRKRTLALHPDRNPDEDTSAQFAAFRALYTEVFETEEKRQAYDSIKTKDELARLTKRVRELTMGGTTRT